MSVLGLNRSTAGAFLGTGIVVAYDFAIKNRRMVGYLFSI